MRKLNLAPQPSIINVVRAACMKIPRLSDLSSPWLSDSAEIFWVSRTAWSLEILARWQLEVRAKSSLNVWIPDYFCNAALEPLRKTGANLVFYPINLDYTLNRKHIAELTESQKPDIFIHVHYFGLPNRCPVSLDVSKKYGALLVEDAAHAMQPTNGIGDFGDCVLYSPHKHLPIPDGAALVMRKDGPSKLGENAFNLSLLRLTHEGILLRGRRPTLGNFLWTMKRVLQRLGYKSKLLVDESSEAASSVTPAKYTNPVMSNYSKGLLATVIDSLTEFTKSRQNRDVYWRSVFPADVARSLMDVDANAHSPYLTGFELSDVSKQGYSIADIERTGLTVLTWPDLPPEVLNNSKKHSHAILMKKNRFFLPVHPNLSISEMLNNINILRDKLIDKWEMKSVNEAEWLRSASNQSINNLLQSWPYGSAKAETVNWKVVRFVILDGDKKAVALVQAFEKKIPLFGSLIRISHGPTMLSRSDSRDYSADYSVAVSLILKYLDQVNCRVLQCSFDINQSQISEEHLRALGFNRVKGFCWGSGLIDLNFSEIELRQKLNSRWKRVLKKTVKNQIIIKKVEVTDEVMDTIISAYELAQGNKAYTGISSLLIRNLSKQCAEHWNFNIFVAYKKSEDGNLVEIGFRVCIRHGNTTTDFLVDVNDLGREFDASSALYWHAILYAKSSGCKWFDLGGLNEATPKGIADFKRGLNSTPYLLAGDWRFYNPPRFFKFLHRFLLVKR